MAAHVSSNTLSFSLKQIQLLKKKVNKSTNRNIWRNWSKLLRRCRETEDPGTSVCGPVIKPGKKEMAEISKIERFEV